MPNSAEARQIAPRLIDATSWTPQGDNRFVGDIDSAWGQGRAVYGGVVGAGLARAMGASVPSEKTLRSFSVTFAGPVETGALECLTDVVREGRTATFVSGLIVQKGTVRATASGTFGAARESAVHVQGVARPDAPAPDALPAMPYFEGVMPSFTQHLEFRWTHGKFPFSGVEETSIGGWFRFRDNSDPADASGMLALIDSWPAPALQNMKVPAPASSITWSVDLFTERPDARLDEWWYFDARTVFVADGYTSFEASLWAPDGQYVARSCQLVGVFG
jgi:acyl-CoA thioesterase